MKDLFNLPSQPLPSRLSPIVILGAGGIVKDAHLPAYKMAGFKVHSICNRTVEKAQALADAYQIPHVFSSTEEAIRKAPADAVFDLTYPASMFASTLKMIPEGAHVLVQKPMGEDMAQANEILEVCRSRRLKAAINCQLRFAPFVTGARHLIQQGLIGDLTDMEMRLNVHTPWNLFPFLKGIPRVEIVYHSVHYIDLFRSFLGEPRDIQALTLPHPQSPDLATVRSAVLMNYGDRVRATITTNHNHDFGDRHQESYLKWEGTKGSDKGSNWTVDELSGRSGGLV